MILIYLGLTIWVFGHMLPSAMRTRRGKLMERFGESRYKGAFAFSMFASVSLIILGWQISDRVQIYSTPYWTKHLAIALMLLAFLLFGASKADTNIRRYVRHPQLLSTIIWAVAHLVSNGDQRSLVVFGVLLVWAVVTVSLVNAREGAWEKPEPTTSAQTLKNALLGTGIFGIVFVIHAYLIGVHPLR